MKKVLVTGAGGFIGRHVIDPLISRGYEVHLAMRKPGVEPRRGGVAEHRCDLLRHDQAAALIDQIRPTHLLHLAWYTKHGKFWRSELNLDWLAATAMLVKAFVRAGGQRFVAAGTCAEYDWQGGLCVESSTPTVPRTLYGACKLAAWNAARTFAADRGVSAAWGRVFFLHGPAENEARFVPAMIDALLRGEPAVCKSGSHERDFLGAPDVADAFVALLDSGVTGPVNIASGQPVQLGQVVQLIGQLLSKPQLVTVGQTPPTPDNPLQITADVTCLRQEVRWEPKFSLNDALLQTIEDRRSRIAGKNE